jgi:hypothetical protein
VKRHRYADVDELRLSRKASRNAIAYKGDPRDKNEFERRHATSEILKLPVIPGV